MPVRVRAGLRRARVATKTPAPAQRDVVSREVDPGMGQRAKWSRREASIGAPPCNVPGCHAFAISTLRTHPDEARAWLVDGTGTTGDALCARHADALRAPNDWVLHDERAQRSAPRRSVERTRRGRVAAGPGEVERLDLRRYERGGAVDDLLDARSPLLSRAFAKSRD